MSILIIGVDEDLAGVPVKLTLLGWIRGALWNVFVLGIPHRDVECLMGSLGVLAPSWSLSSTRSPPPCQSMAFPATLATQGLSTTRL